MPREGSAWRKWDLHVHAPSSVLNNQFEGATPEEKWGKYFAALEALGDYGCLGITDYFSIDGYTRVRAHQQAGGLANVALLVPNVELRIVPVTKGGDAVNVHLLLNPSIADELDDLLFGRLGFAYRGETYPCTRSGLTRLGRAFDPDPKLDDAGAYIRGVGQFKVEPSSLRDCLTRSRRLADNALVVLAGGKDGSAGLSKDSGVRALREELCGMAHALFSGNPTDREYFLGRRGESTAELTRKYGGRKPCVHGCDAHSLDKLGKPTDGRHTWIKADTTFEGLRQICHEPEGRVHIGEHPPAAPVHRITAARLEYPATAVVRWKDKSSDHAFCFRGRTELAFAAGLTCVIGGRGAGKSTLLNVIHERLAAGENEFLRERSVRNAEGVLAPEACVTIDFQGDQGGVEFISQNQVEQFALDPEKLTKAILTRLLALDGGKLAARLVAARAALDGLQRRADLVSAEAGTLTRMEELGHTIRTHAALVASFTDPAYQQSVAALQAASATLAVLQSDRAALRSAVDAVSSAVDAARLSPGPNAYQRAAERFTERVRAAVEGVRGAFDLASPNDEERAAQAAVDQHRAAVESFLTDRGLTPENLKDVAGASQRVAESEAALGREKDALAQIRGELVALVIDTGLRQQFDAEVNDAVKQVNAQLEAVHRDVKDVKRIQLVYEFDDAAAEQAAVEELCRAATKAGMRQLRSDHVRLELDKVPPVLDASVDDLVDTLRKQPGKTAEVLDAYFGVEVNRRLWDISRERHTLDVAQFMRLGILYDGKPLDRSSFGQRCSAVLIVLLMLGNAPIIIDEPEAHLDSALIANYLVDLVKTVKHQRQIIFATHNANFVVNGDAELIHVVSMDDHNRSQVRSITIEDADARPLLLALEGGETAFLQREGRYRLSP